MGEKEHRMVLAARLSAGTATDKERDEALAEIMYSLWSDEDLDRIISAKIDVCRADCTGRFSFAGMLRALTGMFTN